MIEVLEVTQTSEALLDIINVVGEVTRTQCERDVGVAERFEAHGQLHTSKNQVFSSLLSLPKL
jgi:hypothetical protein